LFFKGHLMNRRDFVVQTALATAAIWVSGGLRGPFSLLAAPPPPTLALLADAHLKNGDPGSPEAQSLARAVAGIRTLTPAPRLVLFAGDLAHEADPMALALGEEILSELPMPILAVRGEGDGRPQKGGAGGRLLAEGRFFHSYAGINFLGLDTVLQNTPEAPAFALGEAQLRWLDRVLSGLDPAKPLIILSHAPLIPIFPAWGQWTMDSGPLLERLARFENVTCFHGHVHQGDFLSKEKIEAEGFGHYRKPQTENREPVSHLALPATSWPLPSPLTGTPETLRPGSGPRGCGWAYVPPGDQSPGVRQMLWQA
jgi:3',5'-cyclic AMP phosphodiesterase CpdA